MSWFRQLFSRRRRYDELSESIHEHIDEMIAVLTDNGMPREKAERTAYRQFGNVTLIEERSREVWQWPTAESFWADLRYALRQLRKSPGFTLTAVRLDPGVGVRNEFTMIEHIHDGQASYRRSSATCLVGGFAACALLLGVIGLYGVIAYSVSQRTREIGVRMALGAQRSSIGRLILREAAHLVVLGSVIGASASFLTGRLLGSLLFGVRSWNFSILIGVTATLAAATFIAAWMPARRAAATNPMEALRNE